jgi:hypothetical protein
MQQAIASSRRKYFERVTVSPLTVAADSEVRFDLITT